MSAASHQGRWVVAFFVTCVVGGILLMALGIAGGHGHLSGTSGSENCSRSTPSGC